MRDNEVVNVGPEPLSFEQVVKVARYGVPVRLTDDAVAAMAAARTRVERTGRAPRPRLRRLDRVRRAGHPHIRAELRAQLQRSPDPLARRGLGPRGRARGGPRADAAAPARPGDRPHRRAPEVGAGATRHCSTPGSPRSCTSTAASAARATSRRCRTCALAVMGEGDVARRRRASAAAPPRRSRAAGIEPVELAEKEGLALDQRHRRHARHAGAGACTTCASCSRSPTSPRR